MEFEICLNWIVSSNIQLIRLNNFSNVVGDQRLILSFMVKVQMDFERVLQLTTIQLRNSSNIK